MLTVREKAVLNFIESYFETYDCSPTASEIAQGIKIQSRGVVHRYLKALEEKGHIRLAEKKWRNIQLIKEDDLDLSHISIPLLGRIAAGSPIEAISNQEVITLSDYFVGEGRYALRVYGDSMVEEGILNDDIIVCYRASTARNGQIVVALIDNESATLKTIQYNADQTISLIPANPNHQVQIYEAHRVVIQGVFVGLFRFPQRA